MASTLDSFHFKLLEDYMDNFQNTVEPPRQPYAMKLVGSGVIVSCLLLCVLFAWGIYLDLQKQDCPQTVAMVNDAPIDADAVATVDSR